MTPISDATLLDSENSTTAGRIQPTVSIHAGLIVASHRAADTEAVVTGDGVTRDAGYVTVWA